MKTIQLTKGATALIDDEDYELIMNYKWVLGNNGRALAHVKNGEIRKYKHIYMHRLILGLRENESEVDHIDRNPLNNQKSNLRLATRSQQNMNKINKPGLYKRGVSRSKNSNGWWARIKVNGKNIYLGTFPTIEEAHAAHVSKSLELFGEYSIYYTR